MPELPFPKLFPLLLIMTSPLRVVPAFAFLTAKFRASHRDIAQLHEDNSPCPPGHPFFCHASASDLPQFPSLACPRVCCVRAGS